MTARQVAEIIDFQPEYSEAFRDLNVEWLEKYFRVEPIDHEILGNPVQNVIDGGGSILFARLAGEIVGTVALKHHGDDVYELTKMAVTEQCQGGGIGRRLMEACIERFRARAGRMLYLESHSDLAPALRLYESAGFEHRELPDPSDYERANVYMILRNG
jgi:ribosomal protein S18 acetylase RimI-like enzyme